MNNAIKIIKEELLWAERHYDYTANLYVKTGKQEDRRSALRYQAQAELCKKLINKLNLKS